MAVLLAHNFLDGQAPSIQITDADNYLVEQHEQTFY